MRQKSFKEQEVKKIIKSQLSSWSFENNSIKRDYEFKTFVQAFSFMTSVALEAEKLDHHPDWSNSYNKVKVVLTNHEANGVTQVDIDLAKTIDIIFDS